MKLQTTFLILSLGIAMMVWSAAWSAPSEFTEEQRLQGFAEQQRRNAKFDEVRESGAPDVTKKRNQWDEEIEKSVGDYKAWKARQIKSLDENSPEYAEDQKAKRKVDQQWDEAQADYVKKRDQSLRSQKSNVLLTEEHEYGLDEPVLRADIRKRVLYGAKSPWTKGAISSSRGGGSGPAPNLGGDFSPPAPPPPADFGAPPPPSGPDFYEPDIPPPPPPPEPGSFDEPIPPPVFDDPDF